MRRRGNTPEGRGESRGDSKRKRLVVPSPSLWSERGYILWRTRPAAPLGSRSSFPRPRKTGGKSTLLPAAPPFFCGDWARTHAAEPPSPRKCRPCMRAHGRCQHFTSPRPLPRVHPTASPTHTPHPRHATPLCRHTCCLPCRDMEYQRGSGILARWKKGYCLLKTNGDLNVSGLLSMPGGWAHKRRRRPAHTATTASTS